GGRAPDTDGGAASRDRGRPACRYGAAVDGDHQIGAEPEGALRRGLPARYRQGPDRGPLPGRGEDRAHLVPETRADAGRDGDGGLADRGASDDELHRPEPRYRRPQDGPG